MKSSKRTELQPLKPKHLKGRPVTRTVEPIDASPEEIVKAMFRVADREVDERLKKSR